MLIPLNSGNSFIKISDLTWIIRVHIVHLSHLSFSLHWVGSLHQLKTILNIGSSNAEG